MKTTTLTATRRAIREHSDPEKAQFMARFFKAGPGEYAEGDQLLGIKVPILRRLSRQHRDLPLTDVEKLLHSPFHEERLTALLIAIEHYRRADSATQKKIYQLYLANTEYINNWDLVDVTAPHIVGDYLLERDRSILHRLAKSPHLWERRIAMLSTFPFIRHNDFDDTLKIADILLGDDHDLIHKAVGWMLREVGNRNHTLLEEYLRPRYAQMPRTMLRYTIEKFPENRRKQYLAGRV